MEYDSNGKPAIRVVGGTGGSGGGSSGGATEVTLTSINSTLANIAVEAGTNYSYVFTYDANDNIQTETRTANSISQTRTYTWDANDLLTSRTAWV